MEPSSNHSKAAGHVARTLLCLCIGYTSIVGAVLLAAALFMHLQLERYEPLYCALVCHAAAAIVCAIALARIPRGRQIRPWVPKLILLMVTMVFILSADQAINVMSPPPLVSGLVLRFHDQRGWATRPGSKGIFGGEVRIDQYGLRVTETGPIRGIRGRCRILFIGDSLTFGYGLAEQEAFCEQTVDILNQRRPDLHVVALNAGVTSYDLGQECHLLTHEGFELRPDLVVLQVCLNDITTQFVPTDALEVEGYGEGGLVTPTSRWSGFYRLALRLANHLQDGGDQETRMAKGREIEHFEFEELLRAPPTPRVTEAWEQALKQLASIITACRQKQVPLVVLCFPFQDQVADATLSVEPQIRLADFARQHRTVFLDMLQVYEARAGRNAAAAARCFGDQTHPSVIGHRIAGEALADLLESTGLLNDLEGQ